MENVNDKTNENLIVENLEDVNGGVSAKQVLAAASLAVMGSNFAASSPIVRADDINDETSISSAAGETEGITYGTENYEFSKSTSRVEESVRREKDKSYKEVYNSAENKIKKNNQDNIDSYQRELELYEKKLGKTKDPKRIEELESTIKSYSRDIKNVKNEEKDNIEKAKKELKEMREIVSKDFDNNTIKYLEYKTLYKILQGKGIKGHPYMSILEKSKSVEKCLNAINDCSFLDGISEDLSSDVVRNYSFSSLEVGDLIFNGFLKKQSNLDYEANNYYDSSNFAADDLKWLINDRKLELISEIINIGGKQVVEKLNRGKFIDATIELEKYIESSRSAPDRSFVECLRQYVEEGGLLGCKSIQRELRDMTQKISKFETNGEIIVNLDSETYRQLMDIIKNIQEKLKSETIKEDTKVYRGITIDGFIKMLKLGGINLSKNDCSNLGKIERDLKGKTFFKDEGFMSTSIDRDVALGFVKAGDYEDDVLGTVFEINLKKGTHAINVNEMLPNNMFRGEKEILLPTNTKLKFNGFDFEESDAYAGWDEEKNEPKYEKKRLLIIQAEVVE